jgi:transposase
MDRYIGIDVHAQSCTVAVLGPTGKQLWSTVVETNGEALVRAVTGVAGRRHVCFEEGTQSGWLHELLEPYAEEIVVAVPPARQTGSKSDAIDAWQRADELRLGKIERPVFKRPTEFVGLRQAVRAHFMIVGDVVRAKNRLKSIFRSRGIQCAGQEVYNPAKADRWLEQLPAHHSELAKFLLDETQVLAELRDRAEQRLEEEASHHAIVQRLATAPGIGPIRAAQIVATVVTPHRFRTKRQFWSYCGLGIVTRSSADWARVDDKWVRSKVVQTRGLNRNRNSLLKMVFKGAASSVIRNLPDHPLCADYHRKLAAETKPNLARLTLARRIAAAVLALWKNQEDYDPAKHCTKKD